MSQIVRGKTPENTQNDKTDEPSTYRYKNTRNMPTKKKVTKKRTKTESWNETEHKD